MIAPMKRAQASVVVPGPVEAVEDLWLDSARWSAWLDGFGRVVSLDAQWPSEGAVLVWESRPGGRGRVRERVAGRESAERHALEVEDEQLEGTQTVAFRAGEQGVLVELVLAYELKERNPFTGLVDLLYIRRALRASLQRSLARFAQERIADAELG